jgi:outer membrane receptor protein involved in Fe transport
MRSFITISIIFVFASLLLEVFAQNGGMITGKIVDAKTGEEIIGANVIIEGTNIGAATDLTGSYKITNIKPGKYTVIISYISYTTIKIKDVTVTENIITKLDAALTPSAISVDEIIIVDKADHSYESALLNQRKKTSAISDGISAEQIRKSPDATSGDVMKRITGVSLVENKFVFVRGTSERYSNALLNNVSLPGTEPDKKSFAFDILPGNLLENIVVLKSFTPDVPGDFSGGLIKLNTVDFPPKLTLTVNQSTSFIFNNSLKSFKTYSGGKLDFLGIDDGTRSIPNGFPSSLSGQNCNASQVIEYAKLFQNKWAPQNRKAPLNNNFLISLGDGTTLLGQNFGFVTALSYRSNFSSTSVERNEYESSGEKRFGYKGVQSTKSTLWGGLLNFSYKLSNFHKLSIKNTYTHTSDDEVSELAGAQYTDAGSEQQQTALRFISRSVFSTQIEGEHYFSSLNGAQLQWRTSLSESKRNEPDYRRIIYARELGSDEPFAAVLGFQANLKNGGRFYSDLYEKTKGAGVDFTLPISDFRLKLGGLFEDKKRNFNSRLIGMIVNAPGNGYTGFELLYLPLEEIFNPENFRRNGFSINEYANGTNNYTAGHKTAAGYFMFEAPLNFLNSELKLIGGVRVENSIQKINSMDLSGQHEINIELKKIDLLPSLNLIYKLYEDANLRLGYSQTVNRPELRELAPFSYFDFITQTSIRGNEDLQRALIRNYDLRFEIFPSVGELISVSLFYKNISNAIEQVVVTGSALGSERTFLNANKAVNYGLELEARFSLGFLGSYLSNFSVNGNYTRVHSSVEIDATETTIERRNRPLQGQSPSTINLGLQFNEPFFGTSYSLLYNRFGRRIMEAATAYEDDITEEPRDLLDFVITQPLISNFEVKLSFKDILSQNQIFKQGKENARVNSREASVTLGISYKL